ncbi:MAG: peptidylprolyl isomerase [Candidatus Moranbacteria bacterium]|nr:peptidylprolyl isomerase [Candidatus Moranbacteria bacterium]
MNFPLFAAILILFTCILQAGCAQTKENNQIAVIETTAGTIEIALWPDVAPKAVDNFVQLIEKGYYDNTVFHRVIKGFMLQGGDPTATGRGGQSIWGGKFEDEVNPEVKFDRKGLLAMANAGPNTNGSQFFITVNPTPWLNMKHTIFGEVINGYDVVEKIENCQKGPGDRPVVDQKIIKATIVSKKTHL